jgi:hypothetical protein
MKVFLSWSGSESHQVACIFRDWLPLVIQSLEPFISSDIEKGERWSADIARELEAANFGILCVTRENLESPWLHFEAGALSKTLNTARVAPFLFRLKRSDIPGKGPLVQFQSTIFESADVLRLVTSLNNALDESRRLDSTRLEKIFFRWWPDLEKNLNELPEDGPAPAKEAPTREEKILEELLEIARSQSRLIAPFDRLAFSGDLTGPLEREVNEANAVIAFRAWLRQEYPREPIDQTLKDVDLVLGLYPDGIAYDLFILRSRDLARPKFSADAARLGMMIDKGRFKNAYCVLVALRPDLAHSINTMDWPFRPGVGLIVGFLGQYGEFEELARVDPS